MIDIVIWTGFGGADGEVFSSKVYEFAREYSRESGVQFSVKVVNRDFMANYRELLTMAWDDPYFPDAFVTHAYKVDEYRDKIHSFENYKEFEKVLDTEFLGRAFHGFSVFPYAVPIDVHSAVLYFREDVLRKIGVSSARVKSGLKWSEFLRILARLKKKGYTPFAFLWEFPIVSTFYIQNSMDMGFDPEDYRIEPLKKALDMLEELSEYSTGPKYGDPYGALSRKEPVFAIEGMWNKKWMHDDLGYSVAPVPVIDSLEKNYCWAASHVFAVSRKVYEGPGDEKSKNLKKKFLRALALYLISPEFQGAWADVGFVPVNKAVREKLLKKDSYQSVFASENFFVFPFRKSMKDVWGVFETSLMRVFAGEPSSKSALYMGLLFRSSRSGETHINGR